jgi:hypothetical protein
MTCVTGAVSRGVVQRCTVRGKRALRFVRRVRRLVELVEDCCCCCGGGGGFAEEEKEKECCFGDAGALVNSR